MVVIEDDAVLESGLMELFARGCGRDLPLPMEAGAEWGICYGNLHNIGINLFLA